YTMFKPDGTPMRAICTLDVEEIPSEPGRQNPTSGGLAARRSHTVVAGDSLASIAYRDRKSTRLNSSHVAISYAVFCLKKKNIHDLRSEALRSTIAACPCAECRAWRSGTIRRRACSS